MQHWAFLFYAILLMAQIVKCLPTMRETWVRSLGREDPLEMDMATHSSTLAWKIPWTEEPCKLQSTGSQRVGHDWATSLPGEFWGRSAPAVFQSWDEPGWGGAGLAFLLCKLSLGKGCDLGWGHCLLFCRRHFLGSCCWHHSLEPGDEISEL